MNDECSTCRGSSIFNGFINGGTLAASQPLRHIQSSGMSPVVELKHVGARGHGGTEACGE